MRTELQARLAVTSGGNIVLSWHFACTEVLPAMNSHDDYKVDSISALIHYFAEEHTALLRTYRPVVIRFAPQPDPNIAKELQLEEVAERERHRKWKEECSARETAEKKRLDELKKVHARYGQWNSISAVELRTLVWSKPTIEIAKEFGISDVAIGKRCKAIGIPKPPAGFWAKVAAGTIRHPHGHAVDAHGDPLPEPPTRPKPILKLVKKG